MNMKINDKKANRTTENKTSDPTFDENKFLTNCLTVAFDEIFRRRNFFAVQYNELFHLLDQLLVWESILGRLRERTKRDESDSGDGSGNVSDAGLDLTGSGHSSRRVQGL